MKIKNVSLNNHKKCFVARTQKDVLELPFSKLGLRPKADDKIEEVFVDPELRNS